MSDSSAIFNIVPDNYSGLNTSPNGTSNDNSDTDVDGNNLCAISNSVPSGITFPPVVSGNNDDNRNSSICAILGIVSNGVTDTQVVQGNSSNNMSTTSTRDLSDGKDSMEVRGNDACKWSSNISNTSGVVSNCVKHLFRERLVLAFLSQQASQVSEVYLQHKELVEV